jgi:hypothetical protein
MNTNKDLIENIMQRFSSQYIYENISLDSEWKRLLHFRTSNKLIYEYFDLGRDGMQKFKPFSKATFGDVKCRHDRINIFRELNNWFYSLCKKKIPEKKFEFLFDLDLISLKDQDLINPRWKKLFQTIRKYISTIPDSMLLD